jgi:hypothetical protein
VAQLGSAHSHLSKEDTLIASNETLGLAIVPELFLGLLLSDLFFFTILPLLFLNVMGKTAAAPLIINSDDIDPATNLYPALHLQYFAMQPALEVATPVPPIEPLAPLFRQDVFQPELIAHCGQHFP